MRLQSERDSHFLLAEYPEDDLSAPAAAESETGSRSDSVLIVEVERGSATGLGSLTPEDVDRLLAAKAAAGMSRNSVARIRAVLNDALRHAERRVLVTRNVATLAV
ncbi:MAG: hypothetical protein ACRDWV_04430, partial [Acidimicrobiales bacterium]